MALTHPPIPAGTDRIVSNALARAAQSNVLPPPTAAALTGGGGAPLAPTAPHQVYTLGFNDIKQGTHISAVAKPVGWRVLLADDQTAHAAVEFEAAAGAAGGAPVASNFKAINTGQFVAATSEGIRFAEQSPPVQQKDYEVRLLEIPPIYLMALWFYRPDDDLFLPLKPAPGQLRTDQFYNEQDLLKALVPLAQQRQKQSNAPQGPPP